MPSRRFAHSTIIFDNFLFIREEGLFCLHIRRKGNCRFVKGVGLLFKFSGLPFKEYFRIAVKTDVKASGNPKGGDVFFPGLNRVKGQYIEDASDGQEYHIQQDFGTAGGYIVRAFVQNKAGRFSFPPKKNEFVW